MEHDPVWGELKSREEETSGELSLYALIDLALSNNPDTRKAWLESKAAYDREKQAESAWYPQATISGRTGHERVYANNGYNSVNRRTDGVEVDLKFLVLDLGGRAANVREAKEMLLSSNYQFNQAFQDLMLDVETAYYGLYAAYGGLDAAEANTKDANKAFEVARQKFAAGLVTKLDVLQTESNYTKALFQEEQARQTIKEAQAYLANVIGVPVSDDVYIAPPERDKPEGIVESKVQHLIEEAIKQRPDVAAAEASVRSKSAAVQAANSDLWPTVNIGGSLSAHKYRNFGAEKDDSVNAKNDYGYTAYVSVDWNVFDGFYLYSVRNEANKALKAEREKLRKTELEASSDVWTKYYAYNTALKQYDFSVDFLRSSEEAYDLALQGYEAGLKDILDLLSASSDLATGRDNMVTARKTLFVAYAELIHAMGMLYTEPGEEGRVTL